MKFIVLLRGILSLSISMTSSKLTHAQPGCRTSCSGAESTQCIGNFALGSPCTVCFDDQLQGLGFVCNPPICGDPCSVNGSPVDDICFGASDGCTKCRESSEGVFTCEQPDCGVSCSSNNACRGADTCNTCVAGVCSVSPSMVPSVAPSGKPSTSGAPSKKPSRKPSKKPSKKPSAAKSKKSKKSKKKMKRTKKPKALKLTKKPKVLKRTMKPKSSSKSRKNK